MDNASQKPSEETLERFVGIVGAANAFRDPADMAPYLHEMRDLYKGNSPVVLRPASTDQVAKILSLANETRTRIVPQGGNTGLVGGQIPYETGGEVVVSLARLNRIRDINVPGRTLIAEAGAVLRQVQDAAADAGLLFPLSLASEGSCQIGGNIATNAGGVAVLAYGNTRSLVLGLEVVLADGRIWNGLRALRKDNTGYDLKDIFIGSEGTLGIITAAVLQLHARPDEKATAFLAFDDLKDVAEMFSTALDGAGPGLTAFEFIGRIGIDYLLKHVEGIRDPLSSPYPWYVLLELSGKRTDGGVAGLCETMLADAFKKGIIRDAAVAATLAQAKDFWRLREELSDVQVHEGGSIKHDISVPLASIPLFIRRADAAVKSLIPGCRPFPFGHFGDGNVHYNVSQPVGADKDAFLRKWPEVNQTVHEIALELGGSISAEHGIGRLKRHLLKEVKSDVELDLMRKIKKSFDPNGILNPGKVL